MFSRFSYFLKIIILSTMEITYPQTSNSCILVGNKIIDHSDTCPYCSTYIFILDLTPSFNGLGKDNCKTKWETSRFMGLVYFIFEVWWYVQWSANLWIFDQLPQWESHDSGQGPNRSSINFNNTIHKMLAFYAEYFDTIFRGYPAKRALSAMRKHGG